MVEKIILTILVFASCATKKPLVTTAGRSIDVGLTNVVETSLVAKQLHEKLIQESYKIVKENFDSLRVRSIRIYINKGVSSLELFSKEMFITPDSVFISTSHVVNGKWIENNFLDSKIRILSQNTYYLKGSIYINGCLDSYYVVEENQINTISSVINLDKMCF